jgi:hypothetical protein
MDPFSIATGVAGLVSLAIEIRRILNDYIGGVKSAPDEIQNLLIEISTLRAVLQQLTAFLRSEEAQLVSFDKPAILFSVIEACREKIETLCKRLYPIRNKPKGNKIRDLIDRVKWPLQKDECQQIAEELHRFSQTFKFSLTIANWFVALNLHALEELLT